MEGRPSYRGPAPPSGHLAILGVSLTCLATGNGSLALGPREPAALPGAGSGQGSARHLGVGAVIERIKDAASTAVLWVGIAVFIGGLGYVVLQHLS